MDQGLHGAVVAWETGIPSCKAGVEINRFIFAESSEIMYYLCPHMPIYIGVYMTNGRCGCGVQRMVRGQ